MANTILTSSVVARAALATLYETTVMLPLVHRDYEPEFQPGRGASVTIKKPATFVAEEYNGSTVTVQNATEVPITLTLNHHADVTFRVTSRERALSIIDFNAQFIMPALEAISQKVDRDILAFRTDITQSVGDGVTTELYSDPRVLIDAGEVLDNAKVPLSQRYAVVDPAIKAAWLKDPLFNRVDQSGDTAGLRQASLGTEKFGFTPYMTQNVTNGIGVAFHRTAVAFVSRPLELPQGAADASIMEYKGLGLRVVFDYDMNMKASMCSIDLLYGVKTLDADRACLIDGSGSGS